VNSDNPVDKNSAVSLRLWLFVLARVYLGISFLFSDHGNAQPNELAGFLKFALKNGYGWYQNLLKSLVIPHSSAFGTLVVTAEIYVGTRFCSDSPRDSPAASPCFCFLITFAPKARCPGVLASINPTLFSQLSSFSATPDASSGSTS